MKIKEIPFLTTNSVVKNKVKEIPSITINGVKENVPFISVDFLYYSSFIVFKITTCSSKALSLARKNNQKKTDKNSKFIFKNVF